MPNTQRRVFACSGGISGGRNNTEHEKTSTWMFLCVRRGLVHVERTPSTKRDRRRCLFVFGVYLLSILRGPNASKRVESA